MKQSICTVNYPETVEYIEQKPISKDAHKAAQCATFRTLICVQTRTVLIEISCNL